MKWKWPGCQFTQEECWRSVFAQQLAFPFREKLGEIQRYIWCQRHSVTAALHNTLIMRGPRVRVVIKLYYMCVFGSSRLACNITLFLLSPPRPHAPTCEHDNNTQVLMLTSASQPNLKLFQIFTNAVHMIATASLPECKKRYSAEMEYTGKSHRNEMKDVHTPSLWPLWLQPTPERVFPFCLRALGYCVCLGYTCSNPFVLHFPTEYFVLVWKKKCWNSESTNGLVYSR